MMRNLFHDRNALIQPVDQGATEGQELWVGQRAKWKGREGFPLIDMDEPIVGDGSASGTRVSAEVLCSAKWVKR